MGNFTFNFDIFFFGGGKICTFPLTSYSVSCTYGYGCRRDLSKSGNLKKKKTGISFTKLNILYFDNYNISTSFVQSTKFLYFGIHNDSRLLSKIFYPSYWLFFLWSPFLKAKKKKKKEIIPSWFAHPSPPEYLWTLPKKMFCSKMCHTEGYGFVRNWKCDLFICQIWNINI